MYVITLDDTKSKEAHLVSLFIDINTAVYFNYFRIEYIPLEASNKIRDKSLTDNIFRMQDNDSVICGFYCITFIEYMFCSIIPIYFSRMTIKRITK